MARLLMAAPFGRWPARVTRLSWLRTAVSVRTLHAVRRIGTAGTAPQRLLLHPDGRMSCGGGRGDARRV